jgi:hypothetical protein
MPGYHEIGAGKEKTCAPCLPGYGTNSKGNKDCYDCPAGQASDSISNLGTQCYDCDWGKFTKDTRQSVCISCAEYGITLPSKSVHYYTDKRGSNSCKQCAPGSVVVTSSTIDANGVVTLTGQTCVLCTDGKYADALFKECVQCVPGKGSNKERGYSQCYSCLGGTYSEGKPGTPTDCISCPRGKYSGDGSPICIDCAGGESTTLSH